MLDNVLLSMSQDGDDCDLSFERHDGDPASHILCFLPWKTPLALAQKFQLVPSNYLACFVLPNAIVSSEPDLCKTAMHRLISDALDLVAKAKVSSRAVIVGLSMGSAPATAVANILQAELFSVASADRGECILWESPACQEIRLRAERKGHRLDDFAAALQGLNPVDNFDHITSTSRFFIGKKDEYVPEPRRLALIQALESRVPHCARHTIGRGHVLTMVEAMRAFNGSVHAGR